MKDLDLSLLIGLSRTSNTFASETSRIMTAHDLTLSQFAVLEAVVHKGTLSIGEIQRKILSTTGTMPVIIKNLESVASSFASKIRRINVVFILPRHQKAMR